MQAPRCSSARLPSWRSVGSKRASAPAIERPRQASVAATAAAPPAGAARSKGITSAIAAAAVAAVFPTACTGRTLASYVSSSIAAAIAASAASAITAAPGATVTTSVAATTATAAATAGFGFVDAQGATHQLCALEGVDGA